LPPALVARARALSEEKRQRLVVAGRAALARINERKAEIAGAFWDIGDDLLVLAEPGIAEALGYEDLHSLCWAEASLSADLVDELIAIRRTLTRAEAARMGSQSKAAAYLRLAAATPADDTATELFEHGASTPTGERLPPRASARAAERAAKEFRQAKQTTRRGRTTTPKERELADRIRKAMNRVGVRGKVDVLATQPGKPSKLRIEVLVTEVAALKRALPAKG
jgi:hypothetical protein